MRFYLATALLLFYSSSASAQGYLVNEATVTRVSTTTQNSTSFVVETSNGWGVCSNQTIIFPLADAADADMHQRNYATLLAALTGGLKVDIYNYQDSSCGHASMVSVTR